MFYTSVTRLGNMLVHRYIKDGQRYTEFVKEFEYELFLRSDYSQDAVDYHNNPLKRFTFNNLNEMNKFIRNNPNDTIYGNTDPVSQFISKVYPDELKLTNDYVTLNFDIETVHGTGKPKFRYYEKVKVKFKDDTIQEMMIIEMKQLTEEFVVFDQLVNDWREYSASCYAPQSLEFGSPYLAEHEILSISLIASDKKVIYVYGTEEFTGSSTIQDSEYQLHYTYCEDERDLLINFIRKWREVNPEILTGWNISGYDVPYIINRIVNVLGKKFANLLSPASKESNNCIKERQLEDSIVYEIIGIVTYDYMDLYKKFSRGKKESYKLDFIGHLEVGYNKVSFDEYNNNLMLLWEHDYDKFIHYNAVDTLIVNKLDDKLKFINLAITIAHITHSNLTDALGTVKIWDNIIYHMLRLKNRQIPPNKTSEKDAKFMGAFVKKPILGRHGWVITFDLTSLESMGLLGGNA